MVIPRKMARIAWNDISELVRPDKEHKNMSGDPVYICSKCSTPTTAKELPEDWTKVEGFVGTMYFCPLCSKPKPPDTTWLKNQMPPKIKDD